MKTRGKPEKTCRNLENGWANLEKLEKSGGRGLKSFCKVFEVQKARKIA